MGGRVLTLVWYFVLVSDVPTVVTNVTLHGTIDMIHIKCKCPATQQTSNIPHRKILKFKIFIFRVISWVLQKCVRFNKTTSIWFCSDLGGEFNPFSTLFLTNHKLEYWIIGTFCGLVRGLRRDDLNNLERVEMVWFGLHRVGRFCFDDGPWGQIRHQTLFFIS